MESLPPSLNGVSPDEVISHPKDSVKFRVQFVGVQNALISAEHLLSKASLSLDMACA